MKRRKDGGPTKVIPLFENQELLEEQGGHTMDPEKLMDALSEELLETLKAMAGAKTIEEKRQYSEIVKNLSESLGVFLRIVSDMMMDYDMDDYEE